MVSKETRTISELVNAISEEMTRLDFKEHVPRVVESGGRRLG